MGNSVTGSEFGGGSERGHMPSAYNPNVQVNPDNPEAALPAYVPPSQRTAGIDAHNPANGRSVNCQITDKGPWNTHDPYWQTDTRPLSKGQFQNQTPAQNGQTPDQPAGVDLTPAAMNGLGIPGRQNTRQAPIIWNFPNEPFSGFFPFH